LQYSITVAVLRTVVLHFICSTLPIGTYAVFPQYMAGNNICTCIYFYKYHILELAILAQLLFLVEISVNCVVYVLRLPGMKEVVCGGNTV
jgi:hypothetical protein